MTATRPLGCLVTSSLTIVAGIILLITASIYTDQTHLVNKIWNQIYSLSIFSIIIAIFAILFSGVLIYVMIRQYAALTAFFSGLLIFIAFLAVICSVILISGLDNLEEKSRNRTENIFHNYSDSDSVISSKVILTEIQQFFKCCGINGPAEWKTQFSDRTSVPDSCCINMAQGCGKGALNKKDIIYQLGCTKLIYNNMKEKYNVLIGMNFTVMILALISGILGIIYERYIQEQYQTV
jgi:hypothetical protein